MLVQPGSAYKALWDGFGEREESQRSDEIKRLVFSFFETVGARAHVDGQKNEDNDWMQISEFSGGNL
jgi:hypothetical protein